MAPPDLRELQRWLRWAITHPAGAEAALEGASPPGLPARFTEPGPRLASLLAGDQEPGRRATDRLAVYGGGYFQRLHGALEAEYPAVAAALGADGFRDAVAAHLLRRPSASPSLADLGAELAATLEALPALLAARPWVPDLARLERALAEVWLGELPPASGPLLAPGQDPAGARLRLAPTARLLAVSWAVDRSRRDPPAERRWLAVCREGGEVVVEALDRPGFALLRELSLGATLGAACAAAEEAGGAPAEVEALLGRWARSGKLLAGDGGGPG